MGEAFILRKGAGGGAKAPTISLVSKDIQSFIFNITNNESVTADVYWELGDTTPEENFISLASGATSSNIELTNLNANTSYTVYAYVVIPGKGGSVISELTVTTDTIAVPTLTIIDFDFGSIDFTVTNNEDVTASIFYEVDNLTPETTSVSVASGATSSTVSVSGLSPNTSYILYVRAKVVDDYSTVASYAFTTLDANFTAATGGNVVATYELNGEYYKYHKFTSNGTFTITSVGDPGIGDVEYFIVGGGAGGKTSQDTSAGAGGTVETGTKSDITATGYGVTIGGGSTTGTGGSSSIFGISATGGSSGVGWIGSAYRAGSNADFTGGLSATYNADLQQYNGGGGAGAGGNGGNASTSIGGGGGGGITTNFEGSNVGYGGGGGGGTGIQASGGRSGGPGGGTGGYYVIGSNQNIAGTNGLTNRGGGGGGSRYNTGTAGGSGTVIVRYKVGGL